MKGYRRLGKLAAVALSLTVQISYASAQSPDDALRIFSGIVGAAIVEAARNEWGKIPPNEAACLNAILERQRSSVGQLAQRGVGPNDPRIAPLRATCTSLLSKRLRENVECPINTPNGSIASYCYEAFAKPDGRGGFQRLSIAEAINRAGNRPADTALFERSDAQARRIEMQAANPNSTRVPAPNFDCAKAKTDSELSICSSFRLSLLDGEYGSLYRRAQQIDKSGEVKREVREIWMRTNGCAGSASCIEDRLNYGQDYLAKFLRKNGQSVTTTLERARNEELELAERIQRERKEAAERRVAEQRRLDDEAQVQNDEAAANLAKQEAERIQKETEQKVALERTRAEAEERAHALEMKKKREHEELQYQERVHSTLAIAIPRGTDFGDAEPDEEPSKSASRIKGQESELTSKINLLSCPDIARLRPPVRNTSAFNFFGIPDREWTPALWRVLSERAVACGTFDRGFFRLLEQKLLPPALEFQAKRESALKKDELLSRLKSANSVESLDERQEGLDSLGGKLQATNLLPYDRREVSDAISAARQSVANKRHADEVAKKYELERIRQAEEKAKEEREKAAYSARITNFSAPVQQFIGLNPGLEKAPMTPEFAEVILNRLYSGEVILKLCVKKFGLGSWVGRFAGPYSDELAEQSRRRKLFETYLVATGTFSADQLRARREEIGVETATGQLADMIAALPDLKQGCNEPLAASSQIFKFGK